MPRLEMPLRFVVLTSLLISLPIFMVGQTPNPQITSISPTSGAVGTQITIMGTGFGATAGTASVNWTNAITDYLEQFLRIPPPNNPDAWQ